MARIFVSHSGIDSAVALELHGWLVKDGHQVFVDRHLRDGLAVGEEWERRLHERLRWADAVLCVVTSAYLRSVWCTAELATAQSRGSRILPVWAEQGVAHPLLSGLQNADLNEAEAATRERLREALRRLDAAGGAGWPDDRSPFPGLRPLDTDMHRAFFGRKRDVERAAALLRSRGEQAENAALMIVGPSGSGKSSFVRAGLLPALAAEPGWLTMPAIIPGSEPTAALVRELASVAHRQGVAWSVADVRRRLDRDGLVAVADELLSTGPGPRRTRLLLVIDQFEELLNHASRAECSRFASLLGSALAGPITVVGTIRPEFLEQFLADRDLARLPLRLHSFRPLARDSLRTVIEGPARLAGIAVDPGLTSQLITDTDGGDSLPLLAYTLAQLSDGVVRGGRLLASRYEQLGGVQGALTRQADAALADAITASRVDRPHVVKNLLQLVTVDEQGRPTRRRVRRCELPDDAVAQFDAFIARRLLTTDLEHGQVVIGVAHEAFLSAWAPLAEAITAASTALRARRQIDQAAADWIAHGRPSTRLWERGQLTSALTDTGASLRRGPHILTDDTSTTAAARPFGPQRLRQPQPNVRARERAIVATHVELGNGASEFLRASIRRDRFRRRRSTAILSMLLVLALAAAGVAVAQQRDATDGQRIAISRALLTQAETAQSDGDPRTALRLDEVAYRVHPDPDTHAGLVSTVLGTSYASELVGHTDDILTVAYTPDGQTLATGGKDHTIMLWDTTDAIHPRRIGSPLAGTVDTIAAVAFSADGHTLAAASGNRVDLWDVSDRLQPHLLAKPLTEHTDAVTAVAFSPTGHTLATAGSDRVVMLWDVTDAAHPRRLGEPLTGHTDLINAVAFSPAGNVLATASADRSVTLWDVTDPAHPHRLGEPLADDTGVANAVAFAPDGRTIAIAKGNETVELWDVRNPVQPRRLGEPLSDHTGAVLSVAFSPDGHTMATAGYDRAVLLWDVTDPANARLAGDRLTGHTAAVNAIAFAPDGHTLVSAASDRTALVWDMTRLGWPSRVGNPLAAHEDSIWAVASSPDGHTMATASADKTVTLWDITEPTRPQQLGKPLTDHTDTVYAVMFSPDGHILATGSKDHTVILWDVTEPTRPQRLTAPLAAHSDGVMAVAFSPDGRTLATASSDNTVILWDITDPTQPQRLNSLAEHTNGVVVVAFSPDGRTLATGSSDNTVILWDVADPARAHRLGNALRDHTDTVYAVAFAPDGHTMATAGNDHTVILWDVTDPARAHRLGGPLTGYTNGVLTVAFAPDGHTLATADAANTMMFWDVTDPSQPRRLTRNSARANALTFTPDGRNLITGGNSNSAQLWDVTKLNAIQASPMSAACSLTAHDLSLNQWSIYAPGIPYQNTCEQAPPQWSTDDGDWKWLALAARPVATVAPSVFARLLDFIVELGPSWHGSNRIHVLVQINRFHNHQ